MANSVCRGWPLARPPSRASCTSTLAVPLVLHGCDRATARRPATGVASRCGAARDSHRRRACASRCRGLRRVGRSSARRPAATGIARAAAMAPRALAWSGPLLRRPRAGARRGKRQLPGAHAQCARTVRTHSAHAQCARTVHARCACTPSALGRSRGAARSTWRSPRRCSVRCVGCRGCGGCRRMTARHSAARGSRCWGRQTTTSTSAGTTPGCPRRCGAWAESEASALPPAPPAPRGSAWQRSRLWPRSNAHLSALLLAAPPHPFKRRASERERACVSTAHALHTRTRTTHALHTHCTRTACTACTRARHARLSVCPSVCLQEARGGSRVALQRGLQDRSGAIAAAARHAALARLVVLHTLWPRGAMLVSRHCQMWHRTSSAPCRTSRASRSSQSTRHPRLTSTLRRRCFATDPHRPSV